MRIREDGMRSFIEMSQHLNVLTFKYINLIYKYLLERLLAKYETTTYSYNGHLGIFDSILLDFYIHTSPHSQDLSFHSIFDSY